jgi:hypothetical protein
VIVDKACYKPPEVNGSLYNLKNDPYEINKGRLREVHKRRDKELNDMRVDRTSIFAFIMSKLSKESVDEIQGQRQNGRS